MRKRYSRSYTVLSFLTMFSYRELPLPQLFIFNAPYGSIGSQIQTPALFAWVLIRQ